MRKGNHERADEKKEREKKIIVLCSLSSVIFLSMTNEGTDRSLKAKWAEDVRKERREEWQECWLACERSADGEEWSVRACEWGQQERS